jgi:hypothetical protein
MGLLHNIINFIQLGIHNASLLDTTYQQHEYLKNYILLAKNMVIFPHLQKVKSLEFKFENEKFIEYKPRKTKSFNVKISPRNSIH